MEFFVILSNPVLTIQFDGKFLIGRVRAVVLADDAAVETNIKWIIVDSVQFITVLYVALPVVVA